jgi:putative hemolysin
MDKPFIDLDALIASKNPRLLRVLPRWVMRYLKRIIHQEEVNDFMERHKEEHAIAFSQSVIREFNITLSVRGLEHVPASGGYVFASNHPLGGMDAMAIVTALAPVRHDIKFIVNDLLLHLHNLRDIFVGVNKHGKTGAGSLLSVDELFASSQAVFVFPAGLVSRKQKGKIEDLEWKKTFITRAKKHGKAIIPVYVDGQNSNFFYNLSRFRTRLGIKANIEMLYLVDEMYRQQNQSFSIIFGKPIPAEMFSKDKTDAEWAQWMKQQVYALAAKR